MATQKKASGLGRGLDELLEDNKPTRRTSKPLVESRGDVKPSQAPVPTNEAVNTVYEVKTKPLYDTKPKTKSLKANFKQTGR